MLVCKFEKLVPLAINFVTIVLIIAMH